MTLPSHTIAFGNALVADSTRILGPDHPITRTVQQSHAVTPQASEHDPYIRRRRRPS